MTELFARVHTLATTPEQHDEGLRIVRDDLLPWMRETTGFRGLIRLTDSAGGKTLVITLWESEAALQASAVAAERFGDLAVSVSGARRDALDSYQVTLFDLE